MNANNCFKRTAVTILAAFVYSTSAMAVDASTGSKVNSVMAKKWQESDGQSKNPAQDNKRVVNIGSKKDGTCSVNVGTAQPGEKTPKNIVVTTKEVINICK